MALSEQQKEYLRRAVEDYAFPPHYFDFVRNTSDCQVDTKAVETKIGAELTSGDLERVKNGLSNVLYWGYGQMGIRDVRVRRFREKVTPSQLRKASELFKRRPLPSILEIKELRLPEFSGVSFVSKVRMFLDPANSATLDRQIMKIHEECSETLLARLETQSTQIPITSQNSEAYEGWCEKMREISKRYFNARFRAVDIERGFFQLVQCGKVALAGEILKAA